MRFGNVMRNSVGSALLLGYMQWLNNRLWIPVQQMTGKLSVRIWIVHKGYLKS